MNAFVTLALVAALVCAASASPCSDTCGGACDIVGQYSNVAFGPFAPIVQIFVGFCNQGCTVGCGCIDQCTAQCQSQVTACVGDNGANAFVQFFCSANFPGCSAFCLTQCSFNVVTGVVQQFAAAIPAQATT